MSMFDKIGDIAQVTLPVIGGAAGAFFGGPIGGMAGATAGSAAAQLWANQENVEAQRKNQRYQKQLQKDIFAREDNAIFRRSQDLIRSGLSPVLSAGSGAQAGSVVSTKAIERGINPDIASAVMSILQMRENISNTVAQRDLIESQARRVNAEAAIKWHDFQIFHDSGMASNASGMLKDIRDALSALGSHLGNNQVIAPVKELEKKLQPQGQKVPYKSPYDQRSDYQRLLEDLNKLFK